MDEQHIDGNGVAGLLGEFALADLTSVMRTCPSCGDRRPLGEHPAYKTAGVVLRCPSCNDVAVVVGMQDRTLMFEWRGAFVVER